MARGFVISQVMYPQITLLAADHTKRHRRRKKEEKKGNPVSYCSLICFTISAVFILSLFASKKHQLRPVGDSFPSNELPAP